MPQFLQLLHRTGDRNIESFDRIDHLGAVQQPWPGIAGRAQWVRAQALQHRDPAGCERAAQRAMALLLTAGDYELATTIGTQFFIEPYETLAKIDIDNEARAEAEAEERGAVVAHERGDFFQRIRLRELRVFRYGRNRGFDLFDVAGESCFAREDAYLAHEG